MAFGIASKGLAPELNFAENAEFYMWTAGTSMALVSGVNTIVANGWFGRRGAANCTVSRQTGIAASLYCLRLQRDSGTTETNSIFLVHQITSRLACFLAGKQVVLSCDLMRGANFSPAGPTVACAFMTGTGVDETITGTTPAFPTGNVAVAIFSPIAPTTAARFSSTPYLVPATAKEAALRFGIVPAGTAGAADYVDIGNVKLEVGTRSTPFRPIARILAT